MAAAGLGAYTGGGRANFFIPPQPAFMRPGACGLYHRRTFILNCDLPCL
jgi:hypothetical protein